MVKSQKEKLTKKQLEDNWKRALADYLNLEKRIEKERSSLVKLTNAQLLDKVLPVLDELELCQKHLNNKGLQMVIEKFKGVLASEGVEEILVLGEKFDPETMDAVEVVEGKKDRVIEIALRGWRLYEKVLRPAKVKVGNGKI